MSLFLLCSCNPFHFSISLCVASETPDAAAFAASSKLGVTCLITSAASVVINEELFPPLSSVLVVGLADVAVDVDAPVVEDVLLLVDIIFDFGLKLVSLRFTCARYLGGVRECLSTPRAI